MDPTTTEAPAATEKATIPNVFYASKPKEDGKTNGAFLKPSSDEVVAKGGPVMFGQVYKDGEKTDVSAFMQKGPESNFLSIVKSNEKDAEGKSIQVGTANLRVTGENDDRLAIKITLQRKTESTPEVAVWANASTNVEGEHKDKLVKILKDLGATDANVEAHFAPKAKAAPKP